MYALAVLTKTFKGNGGRARILDVDMPENCTTTKTRRDCAEIGGSWAPSQGLKLYQPHARDGCDLLTALYAG
jgi:hypothetical protein